jgi:hypothetical protein
VDQSIHVATRKTPWNKGKLVGQKPPLKLKDIWAIRVRLQIGRRTRELALFNLAINSKLRSRDLVRLRVKDVCHGAAVVSGTIAMQQKTQRPVQFEITEQTRDSLAAWIRSSGLDSDAYLFPSRLHSSPHLSTRQYVRIVRGWLREIGLDASAYGTHTLRRTKASLIYRRTKNLRVVQVLLGYTKIESTVRYLEIELDDALEISEQTEVSCSPRFDGWRPVRTPTGHVPSLTAISDLPRPVIQATSGPPRYAVLSCSEICRLQRGPFSRKEVPAMLGAIYRNLQRVGLQTSPGGNIKRDAARQTTCKEGKYA